MLTITGKLQVWPGGPVTYCRCHGKQSSCGHVLGTFTPPLLLQPQSQYITIPLHLPITHNPAASGLADKQVQYKFTCNVCEAKVEVYPKVQLAVSPL